MWNIQAAGCSRRPVGGAFNERYAHRASHSEAATGLSNTAAACNCRRQDCLRHVIARVACSATETVALQFRGVQTISDLLQEALDFLGIV
jgi:hypothetical protein